VSLIGEGHGNFVAGVLGLNVMAKPMTLVNTLLRPHAGMVDGAIA